MKIILLERIARLGKMGDIVNVKNGFARNYLLPQKKALRANEANLAVFEKQKSDLIARDNERKSEAEKIAEKLTNKIFVAIRSAGETGHLYGSVSTRDIAELIEKEGFSISRSQIELNHPLKVIGIHNINIHLHGDVIVPVSINIARSADEAASQEASPVKAGEDTKGEAEAEAFENQPKTEAEFEEA